MLLSQFWEWQPKGEFHYFSLSHILIFTIGIIAILVSCYLMRNLEKSKVQKVLTVSCIIALILDPIYWIWEVCASHSFDFMGSLPLYYCSLFYMTLPFALWCKNKFVKETCLSYLATFNIISGLMGLIINTNLNHYPVWSFLGTRSLFYHLLMLFVSAFIWFTGYYKPNIKHTYMWAIPLGIMFFPALIVDLSINADYFYLNGGRGTPFEILSNVVPKPVFVIIFYVSVMIVVNLIFFMPTIIKYFKNKKQLAKQNAELLTSDSASDGENLPKE